MIGDLVLVLLVVIVAAGGGIALGMLLAPRIERLASRGHPPPPEEPGDDRES